MATFGLSELIQMEGHQVALLVASFLMSLLPLEALRSLGRVMWTSMAGLGVTKPGLGEQVAASQV